MSRAKRPSNFGNSAVHANGVNIMNGTDLRKWRKSKKLTQIEAAEKIGVSRSTLQKWEADPESETPKWAAMAVSAAHRRLAPYKG